MNKTTREIMVALVMVLSSVAVLAMFMALRTQQPSAGTPAGHAAIDPSGPAAGASAATSAATPSAASTVESAADGGDQYLGYWRVADQQDGITADLHIVRDGPVFSVVADGEAVSYTLAEGKLVPSTTGDGPVFSAVGSEVTMTTESASPGVAPVVIVMQPISPTAEDLDSDKNATVTEGIHTIQVAIQQWAVDHGGLYPDPDLVVSGGQLAGYIDTWPANPLTGQPMAAGGGAGNYVYQQGQGGRGFILTGYGVDGSELITVP